MGYKTEKFDILVSPQQYWQQNKLHVVFHSLRDLKSILMPNISMPNYLNNLMTKKVNILQKM